MSVELKHVCCLQQQKKKLKTEKKSFHPTGYEAKYSKSAQQTFFLKYFKTVYYIYYS